jgi:hypothetical protein
VKRGKEMERAFEKAAGDEVVFIKRQSQVGDEAGSDVILDEWGHRAAKPEGISLGYLFNHLG